MLNMNSPTVQAMLNNTPQGFGNMPVYYGNSPTVTESFQQLQTQHPFTPFPSPKEMLIQNGQNNIYAQTSFTPRNIVGGYNPGFQMAFNGYSNPYMNYNYYMMSPPDQEARDTLETAINNGLTYDEQLESESKLYKTISRIVSKNLGKSEDEAKEHERMFDIYCKYPNENIIQRKKIKPIHIKLKIGDETVADMNPESTFIREQDYVRNKLYVERMEANQSFIQSERVKQLNLMYERAPERQFDNYDLLDFFNKGAGVIMADSLNRELYKQNIGMTSQVYDRNNFRKRLLENNGIKSRDQLNAVERFVGRYGVMPDGRPVSPSHDPSIATSFSYDPKTGQYSVTAPNFIRDRLERARESFIRSID